MRPSSSRGRNLQDTIKLIHSAIGSESTWRFVLVVGLGFGIVASIGAGGLAWLIDKGYKKSQAEKQQATYQAELAEAPYIILDYLSQPKGPSGFYVRNDGRQTAVQVQIDTIRAGNKVATFGELASVRNDGQMMGTYSTSTPLNEVLEELPDKTIIPVIVDYYGFDGERHFQSECTFEYEAGRGLDRKRCRKVTRSV
jgi:hypothetical protein